MEPAAPHPDPEPNPYAPPEDRQKDAAAIGLADLDLSRLNADQRRVLEAAYTKSNVSWYMALWQVFHKLSALGIIIFSGKPMPGAWVWVVIVSAGYLGLGYWAKHWSRAGTLLLLGWHLLFSYHLLFAGSLALKVGMLGLPALVFLFGFMGANAKIQLTRKAMKRASPPVVAPRTFPAPVVRPGPAPKRPEE